MHLRVSFDPRVLVILRLRTNEVQHFESGQRLGERIKNSLCLFHRFVKGKPAGTASEFRSDLAKPVALQFGASFQLATHRRQRESSGWLAGRPAHRGIRSFVTIHKTLRAIVPLVAAGAAQRGITPVNYFAFEKHLRRAHRGPAANRRSDRSPPLTVRRIAAIVPSDGRTARSRLMAGTPVRYR
jgi:hypothetical protein